MNNVRIAVIGAGVMGKRHLDILLEGGGNAAAAVADPSAQAETLARGAGVSYYADYEKMLDAEKPDGVVIATPNQFHAEAALACIARKIPLLLEKPPADTLVEARRIVDAAEQAGVPLLIGHHRRHHPIMRKAVEVLRDGAVGAIVAANVMWVQRKSPDYFTIPWRTAPGGGPVLINAIHDVDCLRMLVGEIDTVEAMTANETRKLPVEDTVAVIFRFKSGALGTLVVSDAASSPWLWDWGMRESDKGLLPQNAYYISGTRGGLALPSLDLWWRGEDIGWNNPLNHERFSYQVAEPWGEQMRHFAAVIRDGAKPLVSGREGLATLAATLAIHESARTGKPVQLDAFTRRA
jgi:predicted dehydrogenase